jgi:hypothetical protein
MASMVAVASAETVVNEHIPISGLVLNECNGETVALSGEAHVVIRETSDGAGGMHFGFHGNFTGVTGTGDQGNDYSVQDVLNDSFNLTNGATEHTVNESFTLISHGSAPNFIGHALFHITVNANGDITVEFTNISGECQS